MVLGTRHGVLWITSSGRTRFEGGFRVPKEPLGYRHFHRFTTGLLNRYLFTRSPSHLLYPRCCHLDWAILRSTLPRLDSGAHSRTQITLRSTPAILFTRVSFHGRPIRVLRLGFHFRDGQIRPEI
jgi:hypothetical protein